MFSQPHGTLKLMEWLRDLTGTIMQGLKLAIASDTTNQDWRSYVRKIVEGYNNLPHDITGYSPNYLYKGIDNRPEFMPDSKDLEVARQEAFVRTVSYQEMRMERHNRNVPSFEYAQNEEVLVRLSSSRPDVTKTDPRYAGPYKVLYNTNRTTYHLLEEEMGKMVRANVGRLKRYYRREQFF